MRYGFHQLFGFGLSQTLARFASGVVTVALVLTGGIAQASHQFGDVATNHPFHDFIDWMADNGVTGGCSASPPLYCPDQAVTRGQMAVFIRKGVVGLSPVKTVNCASESLVTAIADLRPGDVVNVSGTCNENISIPARLQDIRLDGLGSATLNGPDVTSATILVRGQRTTIRGLTITGGSQGILVIDGGTAMIQNNIVQGQSGCVTLARASSAVSRKFGTHPG